MEPKVIELSFTNPQGRDVEVWITYYGLHVGAVSYACAPFWQTERHEFDLKRDWL